MNILAVDPGTKTGWACIVNGQIESGVEDFSLKLGESKGMRFFKFTSWLQKILAELKRCRISIDEKELIVYEDSYQKGKAARQLIIGMVTRIQEICDLEGMEYTFVNSTTLKKCATGKGNISKEMMVQEAERRHPKIEIIDHNQADALLMLDWAREKKFGLGGDMK